MFTKPIYSTQLVGEIPDKLFENITAAGALDSTFLTTMRVLLHKRLPENNRAHLVCKRLYFSASEIESFTIKQAMGMFIPGEIQTVTPQKHSIIIVYTSNQDAGKLMLDMVRANFLKDRRHLGGYALQEDLRVFYARKCNALFYHNSNENRTIIFTDKLELKQFHALQMMLPKYAPSLFVDNPLTDSETDLLKSLGNKSAVEYEKLVDDFAKNLDIRSEIIRTKLEGFETAFERMKIIDIQREIKNHENNYKNYLANLRDLSAKIQEKKYMLAGLECAVQERSGDSELMSYFQCNKSLSIIKVVGTAIEFVAHGYVDIFDEDAFEQYVGNHRGYFYSGINTAINTTQMEKLYRAIFSHNIYKLRICAAYTADIQTGLRAMQSYHFPSESQTYFPNPHIQNYGCIGTYAAKFQEYMSKHDYVGAIDQAVVSARNINFHDSTVICAFAKTLSNTAITCLEKSDGTLITPLEAVRPRPIIMTEEMKQKARDDFDLMLSNLKMSDGKFSYNRSFNYDKSGAAVLLTPLAYRKIVALVTEFADEVGWHGTVTRINDTEFVVEDIFVYPQEVTGATVNTDQEEYSKWLYEQPDEVFCSLKMQGHSHVNMGVSPSTVDENHRAKILEQLDSDMFYIFQIWNKSLSVHTLIYDMKNNILYENKDVEVKLIFDVGIDDFMVDAKSKVQKIIARLSKKKSRKQEQIELEMEMMYNQLDHYDLAGGAWC